MAVVKAVYVACRTRVLPPKVERRGVRRCGDQNRCGPVKVFFLLCSLFLLCYLRLLCDPRLHVLSGLCTVHNIEKKKKKRVGMSEQSKILLLLLIECKLCVALVRLCVGWRLSKICARVSCVALLLMWNCVCSFCGLLCGCCACLCFALRAVTNCVLTRRPFFA